MRAALEYSFTRNPDADCLGRLLPPGPTYLSYRQVGERVRALGSLLSYLSGPLTEDGSRRPFCAIGGPNSVEWICTDLACSGNFIPTVGLHPIWDAERLAKVLVLTNAATVVLTHESALAGLVAALALQPTAVRHIVLLDPASLSAAGAPASQQLTPEVTLWRPSAPSATAALPTTAADAHSVLPQSLAALAALAGAPTAAAPEACAALAPLFPTPTPAWLAARVAAEQAIDAGTGLGPLFHPLCSVAVAEGARPTRREERSRSAAGWVLDAEAGDAEAALDMCDAWSVIFSTGSSGKLKGVPTSRANWAAGNGAYTGCSPRLDAHAEEGNRTVVSHCALSHGLDRGMVWKALLVGGRVGMAAGSGSTADTLQAVAAYKPGLFVTFPDVWRHLYLEACAAAQAEVKAALLGAAAAAGRAPTSPAALQPLLQEQAAAIVAYLLDARGVDAPGRVDSPGGRTGLPDPIPLHWASRAPGSYGHALFAAGRALRGALVRGAESVGMGTGGEQCSWEVRAFLTFFVLANGFCDNYGATEATAIASSWSSAALQINAAGIKYRTVSAGGGGGATTLELFTYGAARRYWGVDAVSCPNAAARQLAQEATRSAYNEGWWCSGDLVEVTESKDPWLRVTGRANGECTAAAAAAATQPLPAH
jgi:acyl-CoA synthetase (AMP-forming)/AMP-acid ligase II